MAEERKLIRPGAEVEFGADIRHWENFTLHRGERGRVEDIDPDTGDLFLRLTRHYPELDAWGNRLSVPAAYARRMRIVRHRLRFWLFNAVPLAIAAAVAAWLVLMAFNREPPWIRIEGTLDPPAVQRGHQVQAHFIAVLPEPEQHAPRYCPGRVQREIVDNARHVWPRLSGETVAVWRAIPNGQGRGEFVTPSVRVPDEAEPGPAIYRVTTFFTCNWLQRVLHWPIIQQGPDLPFTVLP
jgi:hypothetical protein